ncbi:CPBP family intramembrane glutamic endopeptidase [Bacillus testis]|uniref:CPBP family intramembrane glutamic endopeptidase n=1 Tax=Bacillus testis TaxID=1622072 RepID=UPI00067EAE4B|nr:CPBP family intramembrane glutamic endopeptidase [Bacillus testis]
MNNKQADLIKELSDDVLLMNVWLTQGIVLAVALVLNLILFDSFGDFFRLFDWHDSRILLVGGGVGVLVVALDWLMMKIVPPRYYDDGGINERIFSSSSYGQILILTAAVSVCEELLFRGAIQTHTNLWVASIIFALVHYRYLFHPYLFINVMVLSLLFGWIFEQSGNLLVTIAMHFVIDLLLGLYIKRKAVKTTSRTDDYCGSE